MSEESSQTPTSDCYNSHPNCPASSPSLLPVQVSVASTAGSARRDSRTLVPNHVKTTDLSTTERSLSTTTTSFSQSAAGSAPCGGGPASKSHIIPPRPKPGRKPAVNEPQTKRKAQNRRSQQNFRARNKEKYAELALEVEGARQAHRDDVAQMTIQMEELKSKVKKLEEENRALQYYKNAFEEQSRQHSRRPSNPTMFTSQASSHFTPITLTMAAQGRDEFSDDSGRACSRCRPGSCECLNEKLALHEPQDPPFMEAVALPLRNGTTSMKGVQPHASKKEDFSEPEVDFTTYRSAPSRMELEFTEDQACGFCTRPDNCLCRDETLRSSSSGAPLSRVTSATSVSSAPPPAKGTPGSCEACLADPEQQKRCQGLAAQLNSSRTMEPRYGSSIDKLAQNSTTIPGIRSVGCSEAFGLLDGRVSMDMDSPEWRQLRPLQPNHQDSIRRDTIMSMEPSMEPGTYNAMEIDVGSILTTLQHGGRPLKPRPSDGRLATIVERAEELRQASDSPYSAAQNQNELAPVSDFNMDTSS